MVPFRARHGSWSHLYHQHYQQYSQHPFRRFYLWVFLKKSLLCVFISCKLTSTLALRTHTPVWCKKFRSFVCLSAQVEGKERNCEAFWCFRAAVKSGGVWKTSRADKAVGGPFLDLCTCFLCVVSIKYHNKAYCRDFAPCSNRLNFTRNQVSLVCYFVEMKKKSRFGIRVHKEAARERGVSCCGDGRDAWFTVVLISHH